MMQDADWLKTVATLALGAGGARILQVWFENRRLNTQSYRETLSNRIQDLERRIDVFQDTIGGLNVKIALLESENRYLKTQVCKIEGLEG